jgi:hypothetical protein
MTVEELVNVFAKLRPNATFVSIKEYTNNYNEISNFGIVFHIDYKEVLKRSQKIVSSYRSEDILYKEAKRLVLSSLNGRIDSYKNPLEERDAPYVYFKDAYGKYIKGIKAHQETGDLYMFGLLVSKEILVPANYKQTNSSSLTLAKEKIERITPVSKFRQFKLIPRSYKEITIENITIK